MGSLGDPVITGPLGLALTLLGFYLGNRFALLRDIRKERNDLADRLFKPLSIQAERPSPHCKVSGRDLDLLADKTPGLWRRRRVRQVVAKYKQAAGQNIRHDSAYGESMFLDPDAVQRPAAALLRECRHG